MTLEILESKFARKFGVHHEGFWMSVQEIYEFFVNNAELLKKFKQKKNRVNKGHLCKRETGD